jgi:hypothetical protein
MTDNPTVGSGVDAHYVCACSVDPYNINNCERMCATGYDKQTVAGREQCVQRFCHVQKV